MPKPRRRINSVRDHGSVWVVLGRGRDRVRSRVVSTLRCSPEQDRRPLRYTITFADEQTVQEGECRGGKQRMRGVCMLYGDIAQW